MDMIDTNAKSIAKVSGLLESMDCKLTHLVGVTEDVARLVGQSAGEPSVATPRTVEKANKRKAK
jgi:hypothetical protein